MRGNASEMRSPSVHVRRYAFSVSDMSVICQFYKWLSVDVSGVNMIRARLMRDMNVGRQWTDVDMRGFEPVPTHKHWGATHVPRIVTHTRRIIYAHRLTNYAHLCVGKILNRSKFKSRTNRLRRTSTYNHWQSTFVPPTNYANDARSAQKRKSVRNSCVIHAFSLCDWPLSDSYYICIVTVHGHNVFSMVQAREGGGAHRQC
jgi:hypothetical protein